MKDFNDVENDFDTKIYFRKIISIKNIQALHESWIWDGINGESLIFYREDLKLGNKEEILDLISEYITLQKTSTTLVEKGKYVYFNFNFNV